MWITCSSIHQNGDFSIQEDQQLVMLNNEASKFDKDGFVVGVVN